MSATYQLTKIERQVILNLTKRFPSLKAEILSDAQLSAACESTSVAPLILSHKLKCQELRLYAAELTGLSQAVNHTLTNDNQPLLVIDGLPVTYENAATMVAVLSLLGNNDLLEFQRFGALIDNIQDKGVGNLRPSSGNDLHFGLHTDLSFYEYSAPFINFLMVQPSPKGGESLFCDVRDVIKNLSAETISALQSNFLFPSPPRFPDLQPLYAPILTFDGPDLENVRYREDGLKTLNASQEKALEEFEAAIHKHTTTISLRSGQAAIFNNKLLLHGRTKFSDGENEKRCAVRTYLRPNMTKKYTPI